MHIRLATSKDAKKILAIYRYYIDNTTITFEETVPTLEDFQRYIEHILEQLPFLVAEENGEILGYVYVSYYRKQSAYRWNVELSIYVHPNFKGKGIGKALYQELEIWLKKQHIRTIMSCITTPNPESLAFHQFLGFEEVGRFHQAGYKHQQWLDVQWLEKQLVKDTPIPHPFVPLSKLVSKKR